MGSVTSIVASLSEVLTDQRLVVRDQDADVVFPPGDGDQLLQRCHQHLNLADLPTAVNRNWSVSFPQHTSNIQGNSNIS